MTKTAIRFNSVNLAIAYEKQMVKTSAILIEDFIKDIQTDSVESVKKALKSELKQSGFIPSNCFTMKLFNTASGVFSAGVTSEDSESVIAFCKIKASEGKVIAEKKIAEKIKEVGNLESLIEKAKKAFTPEAKKESRKASAQKGAKTRLEQKKGTIVPNAVRQANMSADSKSAESPTQLPTPAARLDRAINCFLALEEQGRADFVKALWGEITPIMIPIIKKLQEKEEKAKKKEEKAA